MDFREFTSMGSPDYARVNALALSINNQARDARVPPCALAAIVARESGGTNELQIGVPPGPGCGVGLCQITAGVDWSDLARPKYDGLDLLDPSSNLLVAAKFFLAPAIKDCLLLRARHADVMAHINAEVLYFALAAYNAGFGAVESAVWDARDPDAITTNHYASGTLNLYHRALTFS